VFLVGHKRQDQGLPTDLSDVDRAGVPTAVSTFKDLSTAGEENIYFSTGDVVAWLHVVCAPEGGSTCAIGAAEARQQYGRLGK